MHRTGLHAVVVIVFVYGRVRRGVQRGIPMRQAVPDFRQENGEAEDQPEDQGGNARPAEVLHGRQDSTIGAGHVGSPRCVRRRSGASRR